MFLLTIHNRYIYTDVRNTEQDPLNMFLDLLNSLETYFSTYCLTLNKPTGPTWTTDHPQSITNTDLFSGVLEGKGKRDFQLVLPTAK